MANIKKLKENGQDIVPITHEQAVLDSNGVTLDSKLNAINNAISRLENNSTSGTPSNPSLEGNIKILTIGNYTIKYNETDDTLDFIYNGATDEPVVPPTSDSYVTDGLSMYIDAKDVATYGSVRDITGNHTITNHGTTITSDNKYLNFVSTESDYIDCGFKPNLTQWSAEAYFYYLSQADSGALLSWGAVGHRTSISVWDSFMIAVRDDVQYTITSTVPTSLTHLVLTYNNGTIIAYVNGVKSQLTASANVMLSQAGNLMVGTKYNASGEFASIHLKSLRFYDGKVLTDEEALQNYRYETKNTYVTDGLSLYIDANDVATYGSVRDITGNQTVTNHGATITSDNKYLNFVSTESDYLDTDFVPNLTQWSAEVYFYFTKMPTSSENVFTWGENPNQIRVAYSGSKKIFAIQCNSGTNYKITDDANILTPHHLILTMNNGTITLYYDGVKSIITSEGAVQTSPQTLTLKIGGNYSATSNFANLNLRMFRFYDGKVLTDKEALQNYNYEINRN